MRYFDEAEETEETTSASSAYDFLPEIDSVPATPVAAVEYDLDADLDVRGGHKPDDLVFVGAWMTQQEQLAGLIPQVVKEEESEDLDFFFERIPEQASSPEDAGLSPKASPGALTETEEVDTPYESVNLGKVEEVSVEEIDENESELDRRIRLRGEVSAPVAIQVLSVPAPVQPKKVATTVSELPEDMLFAESFVSTPNKQRGWYLIILILIILITLSVVGVSVMSALHAGT